MKNTKMSQKLNRGYVRKVNTKDIQLFDAFQRLFQEGLGTVGSSSRRNLGRYKFI